MTTDHSAAQARAARLAMARLLGPVVTEDAEDPDRVADRLRTAPRHRPIVRRWLAELTAVDEVGTIVDREQVTQAWRTARALAENPVLDDFFARCSDHLEELLRDEITLQALLFDDTGADIADEIYRRNPASRYANAVAAAAIAELPGPLRILELGAGIGGTTDGVLDALTDREISYHFTDVGRWFCDRARQRFAGRAGFSVGLCDINQAPLTEQFLRHDHTCVLAANVLHNALDPHAVLTDLHRVTGPGARLVLIETGTEHTPLLVSMRFLMSPPPEAPERDFADERRGTGRIFLTWPRWQELCRRSGWRVVVLEPGPDHPLTHFDQRTLIAEKIPEGGPA